MKFLGHVLHVYIQFEHYKLKEQQTDAMSQMHVISGFYYPPFDTRCKVENFERQSVLQSLVDITTGCISDASVPRQHSGKTAVHAVLTVPNVTTAHQSVAISLPITVHPILGNILL